MSKAAHAALAVAMPTVAANIAEHLKALADEAVAFVLVTVVTDDDGEGSLVGYVANVAPDEGIEILEGLTERMRTHRPREVIVKGSADIGEAH